MLGNETAEKNKSPDQDFSSVSVFEHASVILFYILFITGRFLDIFAIYVMLRSGQVRKNISSFLIFHLSFTHLLFHGGICHDDSRWTSSKKHCYSVQSVRLY